MPSCQRPAFPARPGETLALSLGRGWGASAVGGPMAALKLRVASARCAASLERMAGTTDTAGTASNTGTAGGRSRGSPTVLTCIGV